MAPLLPINTPMLTTLHHWWAQVSAIVAEGDGRAAERDAAGAATQDTVARQPSSIAAVPSELPANNNNNNNDDDDDDDDERQLESDSSPSHSAAADESGGEAAEKSAGNDNANSRATGRGSSDLGAGGFLRQLFGRRRRDLQ